MFVPKLNASLVAVSLLLGLLMVLAGDLTADPGGGDLEVHRIHFSNASPDTVFGGGQNPGADSGDPDDCDLLPPIWGWVQWWLLR